MNATDIDRMTTTDLDHPKSERADLAKKVSDQLGYSRLANRLVTSSPLMETLLELDILPLRTAQVERYKKSKERNGMFSGHKFSLWASIIFALCLLAFAKVLTVAWATPGWTFGYVICIVGIVLITSALGICSLVAAVNVLGRSNKGTREVWRWKLVNLGSTDIFVPDSALSKALQIRRAYPNANFSVDVLLPNEEVIRNAQGNWFERNFLDPFLVVSSGGEKYYIDVWDEKDYKNEM